MPDRTLDSLSEIDGQLIKHWYIGALSYELKKDHPLHRRIYDQDIVFFRNHEGAAIALEDRCLHRGVALSQGFCDSGNLRCPYHGWTFDSNGLVIDIPSEGPQSEESKAKMIARDLKIRKYAIIEQDGAIWIWPDISVPSTNPSWRFPFAEDSRWVSYFMITDFQNEVTHLAQNFMDVPHTVYVHSKWFRDRTLLKVPYELEVSDGRVKATYLKPSDTIGNVMKWVINPKKLPMVHTDEFIFPNLTRVDYRFGETGFVINSQCTPISRYQTRVYTWIAYRGIVLANLLKPIVQFYTRKVITQDVEIMINQGENLNKFNERSDWKSTAADEIHIAISKLRELGVSDLEKVYQLKQQKERTFWI